MVSAALSLDCGFSSKPDFMAKVLMIHNTSDKNSKLIELINSLQDEMKKIDGFKRQLPFCMLLLNDAIATLKEELTRCEKFNAEPVLEQFIPLKNSCSDERPQGIESANEKDKMNWMSSVQLWNSDKPTLELNSNSKKRTEKEEDGEKKEIKRPIMDNLLQSGKNRTEGRNFVSFNELPGLSLCTPEIKNLRDEINSSSKSSSSRSGSFSATNDLSNFKANEQQTARKQRRCWSPELHRRFVNALMQLGGSQVATPKQIRELMEVDGLTNDEVKSHLQKYRIHTRRVSPTSNTSKQSNSQSGSPQGPLNLAGSSRVTSMTGGDSMEDEDDEKSVSHSWKSKFHLSVV
ncbi:hypothetical protein ACJIZ3_015462 [Penstemon smallii]|uniref:HTH myb-type domain-containing protein n=1 Tax=Penstemon smallii TaxID=265156 RepID=A0ABD3RMJ9_9LAMI